MPAQMDQIFVSMRITYSLALLARVDQKFISTRLKYSLAFPQVALYSVKVALKLREGGSITPCRLPARSKICTQSAQMLIFARRFRKIQLGVAKLQMSWQRRNNYMDCSRWIKYSLAFTGHRSLVPDSFCNTLQNAIATLCIFILQFSTFLLCNKHWRIKKTFD